MELPVRSEAQRKADLQAAVEARHERALLREEIKAGNKSLEEVLESADDPIVARMKVVTLIESLPGYGKNRAQAVIEELGISPSRRIQGLGVRQKAALLNYFTK